MTATSDAPITYYGTDTYGAGNYGGVFISATPLFVLEVQTPSGWVDVTCDARTIAIERGRSAWTDGFAAATAVFEFANSSGYYSAWVPWGVWASANAYRTDVPIRLSMLQNGALTTLGVWTTDSVEDSWPETVDAIASVKATDAFKYLARHQGVARALVGDSEKTGARINRLLDDAGWTGPRAIDAGTVTLQATDLAGVALDLMRTVGETEWGWLWVDRSGTITFRQRDALQTDPRMVNVQWTFTDEDNSPAGVCYSDLALPVSDEDIANVAQITPPGLALQSAQDAASVGWFGPRTWTKTDLPFKQAADALSLAQLVILQQASQERSIRAITFDVRDDASLAAALGVRMNDRVRVVRHYPGGYVLDAELLVESIHHDIRAEGTREPTAWTVKLGTFSALSVRDYGQWDAGLWDTAQWGV